MRNSFSIGYHRFMLIPTDYLLSPRTTYTSELRQRNLSVVKDLFLGAKIGIFLITTKFYTFYFFNRVHIYLSLGGFLA